MKLNQPYDLIIIGGGVVGLTGAYFTSRKGRNVLLLEAESGIKHASVRNFGSLVPSGQQMGFFRELGERSMHWYRQFSPCPSFTRTVITKEEAQRQNNGIHVLFKHHGNGEITIGDSHQYYPIDSIREGVFFVDTKINEIMLSYANKVVNIESNEITKLWLGWYLDHADGMLTTTCHDGFHCVTALAGKGMTIDPALIEKVIEQIFFCNRLTIDLH